MAINTYFKNIADAIREKTGGSALITPGNMPGEIRSISGGIDEFPALHTNVKTGYLYTNGSWLTYYVTGEDENRNNKIYLLEAGKTYIFMNNNNTSMFKIAYFQSDPFPNTSNLNGLNMLNQTYSLDYHVSGRMVYNANYRYAYVDIGTTNAVNSDIKCYDLSAFF